MSYTENHDIKFPLTGLFGNTSVGPQSVVYSDTAPYPGGFVVKRRRTGDRLPNWRQKIESGQNATTNLTAEYETIRYPYIRRSSPIWESWRDTNTGTKWWRCIAGDFYAENKSYDCTIELPTASSTFVDNLAKGAFYQAVRSETRKFQGGVFVGEIGETLKMLRRPAFGLQKLIKDFVDTLKKRKRSAPKEWKKNIGEIWLEQSFGWNPLIADSRDAVSAYKALVDPNRQKTTRIRVGRRKEFDTTSGLAANQQAGFNLNTGTTAPMAFRIISAKRWERVTVRYVGAVEPQVEAPTWGTNMGLFGFSPQDFVPTLWELLPWSFLVDYFANVGELLDAYGTVLPRLTYVNRTVLRECWKSITVTPYASQVGKPGVSWVRVTDNFGDPGILATYRKEVTRSADVGITPPSLQFNFNLTDGQLLNVAALLSQVGSSLHPQNKPRSVNWGRL